MFTLNVRRFFENPGTIWVAAEVYNDIAEWSSLPKSTVEVLSEIIASGIVQQSYQSYLNELIGLDSITAIAFLAISLAELATEKLLQPLNPLNSKLLETMLFLLNSDLSSRTFNFWTSFAEASVDIDDGHSADRWLEEALPILVEKSAWHENMDHDEWNAYRTDVVEVSEAICEVLEQSTISSAVISWLDAAAKREDLQEKALVHPTSSETLIIDSRGNFVLLDFHSSRVHS